MNQEKKIGRFKSTFSFGKMDNDGKFIDGETVRSSACVNSSTLSKNAKSYMHAEELCAKFTKSLLSVIN